jgi:hypothetical protein
MLAVDCSGQTPNEGDKTRDPCNFSIHGDHALGLLKGQSGSFVSVFYMKFVSRFSWKLNGLWQDLLFLSLLSLNTTTRGQNCHLDL